MSKIGKIFNPKIILDPFCGIGSLLTHIDYGERQIGLEINPKVIEVAKFINPEAKIMLGDFIKEDLTDNVDLIISTPPFGVRVNINGRNIPYEMAFIDKSLEILKENGTIVALLPSTFLTAPIYENTRKNILQNYSLEEVIDLQSGSFTNTFIRTSIIVINKNKPQYDSVYFTVYDDNIEKIINNYLNKFGDFWVKRSRINNRIDRHFFDPQFDDIENKLKGQEVKEIQEIAEIYGGYLFKTEERKESGKYLILSGKNIQHGKLITTDKDKYSSYIENSRFNNAILQDGDIFISLIFNDPKLYFYRKSDTPAVINQNCAIIRSRFNKYITTYLQTKEGKKLFEAQFDRKRWGTAIPHVSLSSLKQIRIPIIPYEDLNKLSLEEISKNSRQENHELINRLNDIENTNSNHQVIELLKELKQIVLRVEQKVDKVLDMLNDIQTDFESTKNEAREDEQKLFLLYNKLDRRLKNLTNEISDELESYKELSETIILNWDKLDSLSKEIFPLAEYLYSKLQEIPQVDFSPVILQYCKSIENELLKKLFIKFTLYLINKFKDLDTFLKDDLVKIINNKENQTFYFANSIQKAKGKDEIDIKYTFGQMQHILSLTKSEEIVSRSPLYKEFLTYIQKYYNAQIFLANDFLKEIKEINDNYRNKCAHPYKLDIDKAKYCKERIPKDIDYIIDSQIRSKDVDNSDEK